MKFIIYTENINSSDGKPVRIRFSPKIINEPMLCITIEGNPTLYTSIITFQSIFEKIEVDFYTIFSDKKYKKCKIIEKICPITVAIAAPLTPKSKVKIKIGSSIIFVIAPTS